MDRQVIDLIIDHMRGHSCARSDGNVVSNQYPILAEILAERCQPHPTDGGSKYRGIATQLPAIALELGTRSPIRLDDPSIEATMERIERARIDMLKGVRSSLAPAMLMWLWRHNEPFARDFLQKIGFDISSARSSIQAGSMARIEPAGTAANSLYTLHGRIAAARSRLVLVAQNHWHMINATDRHGSRYWPLIKDALERGVDIDIVAMHPDIGPRGRSVADFIVPDAIAAWAAFMHTPEFKVQIDHCWTTLAEWESWYSEGDYFINADLGAFRAYGAYFTPLTFSAIDPDENDGVIVLSPRTPDPRSSARPQFLVRKDTNPEAFNYYWSSIENCLLDHHWVKMVG